MVSAPIQVGKGPRGAARWRKGGGPWRYGKPPASASPAPVGHTPQKQATPRRKHSPIDSWALMETPNAEQVITRIKGDPSKHAEAANYYSHHGDMVVNEFLRHGVTRQPARMLPGGKQEDTTPTDITQLARNTISRLDEFIAARTLKKDVALFRGASLPSKVVAALTPGSLFVDNGFTSTALDKMTASNFARNDKKKKLEGVLFHIRSYAGQSAAYMAPHSEHEDEQEFLLPRGTKFRVVERRYTPTPSRHIIVVDVET